VAASILVATDLDALASLRLGLDAAALAVIYGGIQGWPETGFLPRRQA
jgi:hypothetical protein